MADSKRNKNRCSFCGRSEDEVGFLITGMNGYICDSCATQAYEITQEALGSKKGAVATKLNLKELPIPNSLIHLCLPSSSQTYMYSQSLKNWGL